MFFSNENLKKDYFLELLAKFKVLQLNVGNHLVPYILFL